MFSNFIFPKSCLLWDYMENSGGTWHATGENITRIMHTVCWKTKTTDAHSEYVILIFFARPKWSLERASMLPSCVCLTFSGLRISRWESQLFWRLLTFNVLGENGSVVSLTRGSWALFPPGDRDLTFRQPSGYVLPWRRKVDVWRMGGCR